MTEAGQEGMVKGQNLSKAPNYKIFWRGMFAHVLEACGINRKKMPTIGFLDCPMNKPILPNKL